jgi:chitinase
LDKRDGSHWELFDCPLEHTENLQSVKALCADSSPSSNCDDIHMGDGVHGTIVEMPQGCGPGRYAVAHSLQEADDYILPHHLHQRGLASSKVYDFTFDYNFERIPQQAREKILLRIDYSDDPGYWDEILAPPGDHENKKKRALEIEHEHNGDIKSWLAHTWHKEKRSIERENLHKRWFSTNVLKWLDRQEKVSLAYQGPRHTVDVSTLYSQRPV